MAWIVENLLDIIPSLLPSYYVTDLPVADNTEETAEKQNAANGHRRGSVI